MAKKRTRGQEKPTTPNFRVSHEIKFALEILARKQHRTVSSVVDWSIELALKESGISTQETINHVRSSLIERLWSPIPWQRLANTAKHAPDLMDYEQQVLWHRIKNDESLWKDSALHAEAIENKWQELLDTQEAYMKKVGA